MINEIGSYALQDGGTRHVVDAPKSGRVQRFDDDGYWELVDLVEQELLELGEELHLDRELAAKLLDFAQRLQADFEAKSYFEDWVYQHTVLKDAHGVIMDQINSEAELEEFLAGRYAR